MKEVILLISSAISFGTRTGVLFLYSILVDKLVFADYALFMSTAMFCSIVSSFGSPLFCLKNMRRGQIFEANNIKILLDNYLLSLIIGLIIFLLTLPFFGFFKSTMIFVFVVSYNLANLAGMYFRFTQQYFDDIKVSLLSLLSVIIVFYFSLNSLGIEDSFYYVVITYSLCFSMIFLIKFGRLYSGKITLFRLIQLLKNKVLFSIHELQTTALSHIAIIISSFFVQPEKLALIRVAQFPVAFVNVVNSAVLPVLSGKFNNVDDMKTYKQMNNKLVFLSGWLVLGLFLIFVVISNVFFVSYISLEFYIASFIYLLAYGIKLANIPQGLYLSFNNKQVYRIKITQVSFLIGVLFVVSGGAMSEIVIISLGSLASALYSYSISNHYVYQNANSFFSKKNR